MADVVINILIEGGKASGGPPLGPALGAMGVNVQAIVAEINQQTKAFAGLKVPVKVSVNPSTKAFAIDIGLPPTSALIMKEIGIQSGAKTKDEVVGNITLDQLKKIAKMKENVLYGEMKSKVKQIVGTCKSMNVTCDGLPAKEFMRKIEAGEVKV